LRFNSRNSESLLKGKDVSIYHDPAPTGSPETSYKKASWLLYQTISSLKLTRKW